MTITTRLKTRIKIYGKIVTLAIKKFWLLLDIVKAQQAKQDPFEYLKR
jgi:hypothetical protein